MSEKSVSQKIARFFEIVDYILLVPSLAGLCFGLMMIVSGEAAGIGLGILTVFTIGTALLVGYFKHSRGRLSENSTRLMWFGTIIFNGLFLCPSLYFLYDNLNETNSRNDLVNIIFSPYGWIIVWWTIAVGGAIIALGYSGTNQKYR
ncbi:MAG: hypothetical protein ACR2F2_09670 [Pyrinomonadaceae bacterium]